MPATMNISLPEPLKEFVDSQIVRGGYAGASDYVRDLIRDDQQRIAVEQLRTLIAEGLASGAPLPADKKYWAAKRKQFRV
ncbi:MAG: type II toxin-antitoxin system ParD family antitoxin [Bryocella sp.]